MKPSEALPEELLIELEKWDFGKLLAQVRAPTDVIWPNALLLELRFQSQEDLAALTGVSSKTIGKYERGESQPNGLRLKSLLENLSNLNLPNAEVSQLVQCWAAHVDAELRKKLRKASPQKNRVHANARQHPPAQQQQAALELHIPQRIWDSAQSPPAALLRAEFGVVPFHGRSSELARLASWCDDKYGIAFALATGPGGRGKTRLGIEACFQARARGWLAGFVSAPQCSAQLSALLRTKALARPMLMVIDYAEAEPNSVIEIVNLACECEQNSFAPIRVLLLARSAGEWWDRVRASDARFADLLYHKSRFLRLQLLELAIDKVEANALLVMARQQFRNKLPPTERRAIEAACVAAVSAEALLLFTQALLLELNDSHAEEAFNDNSSKIDQACVFEYLLLREQRYWRRILQDKAVPQAYWPLFAQLVAALTLCGGTRNPAESAQLLRHFAQAHGLSAEIRESLHATLLAVYGNANAIDPLLPDRLGEVLIANHATLETIAYASFRNSL